MKKKLIILLLVMLLVFTLPQQVFASELPVLEELGDLFFPVDSRVIKEKVYLSGKPVGITVDGEGVTVIGLNEYVSTDGVVSPAAEAGLSIGDVITQLNGVTISSVAQLSSVANAIGDNQADITYKRGETISNTKITPRLDVLNKAYKLGVWVRDNASGIGTLTYIRNNLQFGCLGHPILDAQSREIVKVSQGGVYTCSINDVSKGQRGAAGELKGSFNVDERIGTLYVNNRLGVYGNMNKLPENFSQGLYSVATAREIKHGKAHILTTVDGEEPQAYEIDIIKVIAQSSPSDKGLVLRVTDPQLLEKTGGIVQGMSGSPIIQDGKFVGAVTHVFVNDPTKGYGVLAQWMLEN